MNGRRLPASPDRLDAEMRSMRFMHDNLVKTVTDELRAVRNLVEEVLLVVKQSSVSVVVLCTCVNVDGKVKLLSYPHFLCVLFS